jgi:uncharacterized membrane protein YccC
MEAMKVLRWSLLAAVWDRVVAADPGLTRLLTATRVTISVGLAVAAIGVLAGVLRIPLTAEILAAVVAMQTALSINDSAARTTTLLAPIPATLGIVLGALTSGHLLLADLGFLAVLFTAVAIRQYGLRWTALGTITTVTYFVALYLGATLDQLPVLIATTAVAVAVTYLVRFVALREVPAWTARRMVDAFRAQLRLVVDAVLDAITKHNAPAVAEPLRRATLRLNEMALAIENRLPENAGHAAVIVFDAELAADNLAALAPRLAAFDGATLRGIRVALASLRRGNRVRAARVAQRVLNAEGIDPAAVEMAASIRDLAAAIDRLSAVRDALRASSGSRSQATPPQQPALRQAVQVTLASAAAIAAGEALSPQRWYWAVLATYFVFIGTASSGETLARAWSRTLGTAFGIVLGLLAGHLARGHQGLEVGLVFLFLFLGVYFLRVSYTAMIFFVTGLLSLLWGLLGRFSDGLLVIRLLETAIGAAFGAIAAIVILPTRTRDVIGQAVKDTLDAVAVAVHDGTAHLIDPVPAADSTVAAARELDRRLQHLRERTRPILAGRALTSAARRLRRWTAALSACGYYARNFAAIVDRAKTGVDAQAAPALRALDDAVAANVHAAVERFTNDATVTTIDARPHVFALQRLAQDAAHVERDVLEPAVHLIDRLDRAIVRLARDDEPELVRNPLQRLKAAYAARTTPPTA